MVLNKTHDRSMFKNMTTVKENIPVIYEDRVEAEYHDCIPSNNSPYNLNVFHTECHKSEQRYKPEFECIVCFKLFMSKATLECHIIGQRHHWLMTKALDELTFIKDKGKGTLKRQLSNQFPPEDEVQEDQNSSEEGYCTDENKMPNETDNTDNNNITKPSLNGDDIVVERGRSRSRDYTKKRDRTKRKKMDELKEVYKHHAVTRGSNDLYQTMLDTYEDFCMNENSELVNGTNSITPHFLHSKSVNEKEALMKRDLVLTELADTEKDYVDDLSFLVNEYIPLLQKDDVSSALKQNFEVIFGNIEEVYEFHNRVFLEKIEDCLEEPELLKETFCECEDQLATLYSQYCKCKPSADEALEVHEDEMEIIRRKYDSKRKLSVKDYLVKPVQRLMKYQLLLNAVRDYSKKAGTDATFMQDPIEVMERVPKEANDALNVELIQGYVGYLPSTDLIFQESLDVVIGKAKTKPKNMRVFLFEKVVLFTDTVKRSKRLPIYKCLAYGKTSSMGITEIVENDVKKFAIWFRKFKTTDIYVCHAESVEVKANWMQVLKDVIAIQAILQNRVSRYNNNFVDSLNDPKRRRSRSQTTSEVVVEETLRQSMQGHPRLGAMSSKLKKSIEKYILDEIYDKDDVRIMRHRQRSQSLATTLVSEKDMKPRCTPRRASGSDERSKSRSPSHSPTLRHKSKERNTKEMLVGTISGVSFGLLDPLDAEERFMKRININ